MDLLLAWPEIAILKEAGGLVAVRSAAKSVLSILRGQMAQGRPVDLSPTQIARLVKEELLRSESPSLKKVINGSGVVIHTNLGRSPLPSAALEAITNCASGYSNLEFDLTKGERGERYVHVEQLLCELTGAEASLVVNNNAAAVLLALSAIAANREVIVSRGELVEIGGSFRIPDVMKQSGATLVEVGTTNRTHPADYQQAVGEKTALLLKVHSSNYSIVGFTAEPSVTQMAAISKNAEIPVMIDAGSGCLMDLSGFGITGETTVRKHLEDGADLVTFSGDKLLGGPQAGLIVGRHDIIRTLKRHPLLRALRIDKLSLAALEATLRLYRDEQKALQQIPTMRMLSMTAEELAGQARRTKRRLHRLLQSDFTIQIVTGSSSSGGGTSPLAQLPTTLLKISLPEISAHHLESALRATTPPVIGRLQQNGFYLDIRTLSDSDTPLLAAALCQAREALNA